MLQHRVCDKKLPPASSEVSAEAAVSHTLWHTGIYIADPGPHKRTGRIIAFSADWEH